MKSSGFNSFRLLAALAAVSILFAIGLYRLRIDANVVELLPRKDPAIADALYILKHHPIQDQLFIDVGCSKKDPDLLVAAAARIEKKLKESGLFKTVGMEDTGRLVPELMSRIVDNLPVLFTKAELHNRIAPLLAPERIEKCLQEVQLALLNLDAIGQTQFIQKDPLGFRDLVMQRLSSLAPSRTARIYRGRLISADDRHLLITADPIRPGTDTAFALRLAGLLTAIGADLRQDPAGSAGSVTLTPVGAYRSALDNELIARSDMKKAVVFATLGIALLLLLAFPRPYIGLLSLLPAVAGTMTAFFIYSLLHRSISIMVLGFGGAIISIAVDQGIVYLLFLDRPQRTSGREASHEVRSVGLLATLTTVGAFGILCISDFPVFEQLGLFTALGISASFLFVHAVFPWIFPVMPPARPRRLPLQGLVDRLALSGRKGAWIALGFAVGMLFFAEPKFNVSLSAMNTVSKATAAAEKLMGTEWGQVFNRVYLMISADSLQALQRKGDRLLAALDRDAADDTVSAGFVPSMVFPGKVRRRENLAAWQSFWTPARIEALESAMQKTSARLGFTAEAFKDFYDSLRHPKLRIGKTAIPADLLALLNITRAADGAWVQVSTLTTAASYDPERFYARYRGMGRIFDPALFSERLGKILFATFVKMLLIVGISVVVLVFLFFLDFKLTLAALLPIFFAFVCTLGTMNLIGHPLDIAGLMLGIIVFGMGIDYSLFFVRSHQRYGDPSHPYFKLIRLAVFMAAASTIIGFGILGTAEHSVLRSAGLTALLGIGYAAVGTFVILPPSLNRIFCSRKTVVRVKGSGPPTALDRYRYMEAYPRMFVRGKLWLDPMFAELPVLLPSGHPIRTVVDIGCGYGVPASWLLERFPDAMIYGIDPDPERIRVAAAAMGENGVMAVGRAPDVPNVPAPVDLTLMLDMIHYIDDGELQLSLRRIMGLLGPGATLVIRAAMPATRRFPLSSWWENWRCRLNGIRCRYRSRAELAALVAKTGWHIEHVAESGGRGELVWLVVTPKDPRGQSRQGWKGSECRNRKKDSQE